MIKNYRRAGKWLNAFIAFELFFAAGFLWIALRPVKTLEIKQPIPVLNQGHTVIAGHALIYRSSYCKYTDVQAASIKSLISDSRTYLLTTVTTNAPVGCHTIDNSSTIVPVDVAPGTYHLTISSTYFLGLHVPVLRRFVSEDFTVTAPTGDGQTSSAAVASPTVVVDAPAPTPRVIVSPLASPQASEHVLAPAPASNSTPAPTNAPAASHGLIPQVLQTVRDTLKL